MMTRFSTISGRARRPAMRPPAPVVTDDCRFVRAFGSHDGGNIGNEMRYGVSRNTFGLITLIVASLIHGDDEIVFQASICARQLYQ